MTVTVAVIIPTFNRPRLLREALRSVVTARPDEVIVVDDGSAYPVFDMVGREFVTPYGEAKTGTVWKFVGADPVTVDKRMSVPRQGRLLNQALEMVTSDVITMLCDDDLHHPGWYDALRRHWGGYPERELVRGDWLVFEDGATPSESDPPCPLDPAMPLTAGNFAHHASLTRDRGCRWDEQAFNCLDAYFLQSVRDANVDVFRVPTVGLAGWARFHPYQNGNHSDGFRHRNSLRPLLEGFLEAER